MIAEEQIKDIRRLLNESERPLFFFDDDTDGLCSYLLLKGHIKRGRGIVVKCAPALSTQYLRKIREYSPDRVFVLDKPIIEQEFVDEAKTQIVWIDHHPPQKVEGVRYFNPRLENIEDGRPTSYWCWLVAKQKMWLAMCGIVGDWHIPEFAPEFMNQHPDLLPEAREPGQIIYDTQLGQLIRILSFILKGPTSEVAKCIAILEKIESPYEILKQETPRGKYIYRYYEKINKPYQKLLKEALLKADEKDDFLVCTYPSAKVSFSGDLANEVMHRHPDKVIIIGRMKEQNVVLSIRCLKLKIQGMVAEALKGLEGYGGGHEHACGGNLSRRDFHVFVDRLREAVKREKAISNDSKIQP